VILAQDAVDILSFDRDAGAGGFNERRFTHGDEELDLPAIGVRASLSEIYRGLGLAGA
jgi:hypothetical protein